MHQIIRQEKAFDIFWGQVIFRFMHHYNCVIFDKFPYVMPTKLPRGGGVGVTPIDWDTGCAIFLGYLFSWKINFWVYFIACNKFLGQDFNLE